MNETTHTLGEALINLDAFLAALGVDDAQIVRTGLSGEYEHCHMFTIVHGNRVIAVEMPGCALDEVIAPTTMAGSILNRVRLDGDAHDWEEALFHAKTILTG